MTWAKLIPQQQGKQKSFFICFFWKKRKQKVMRINNKKIYKNILLNRQYPFCVTAKIFIFRVMKNEEKNFVKKSQKGNKKEEA